MRSVIQSIDYRKFNYDSYVDNTLYNDYQIDFPR